MQTDILAYTKANDKQVLQSKTFARIAKKYDLQNKRVLDIGCGVGSYMQRFGPDSVGLTVNPNEVSLGKDINRDIRLGNAERLSEAMDERERFDVIWCNNIFEHLLSPHAFLVNLKAFAHPETIIILGTPMVPIIPGLMKIRKFSGALATAHVNFFNSTTYCLTSEFAGWKVSGLSPYFFSINLLNKLFTPIAPHLYLTAKNDSNYRYDNKKLNEWEFDTYYQPLIKIMNPGYLKSSDSQ
jgi:SAM-dependent methyltransferase